MSQVTIADFRNCEGVAVEGDYLFESLHGALTFAFRYSGQQYSPSVLAQMMKGPSRSGKGLSGLDGAAQAGLIRGLIGKLPKNELSMITAKFSAEEWERIEAMKVLVVPAICSLGTGCHSSRVAQALVQRYFGADVHLGDLSAKYYINLPTLTRNWHSVRNNLKLIWERAEELAYLELQTGGLIP